ncbi:MAG: hypothetical protein NFCOHLIN_02410 [Gammaproteobacteria bacterium]|nr:hypothetical protein [Gammaproteobacteria bacterium]
MPFKKNTLAMAVGSALLAASMAAGAASTADLEKRLMQLEAELAALRQELKATQAAEPAQTQQVQSLENRVTAVEAPVKTLEDRVAKVETMATPPKIPGNMIFFRGGYTGLADDRAFGAVTDVYGLGNDNSGDSGWNVGAGFDFLLSHDVWKLMPGTWVLAELGVEFSHIDSAETVLPVPTAECALATGNVGPALGNCLITGTNNLTMLTVSAAPKIKFMEDSRLRPWLIPIGLDFRVISPTSDTTSYLDVGGQVAGGAEYEIIPGIKLGADARYHFAADFTNPDYSDATVAAIRGLGLQVQEPSNDYWTIGGYLGIGF